MIKKLITFLLFTSVANSQILNEEALNEVNLSPYPINNAISINNQSKISEDVIWFNHKEDFRSLRAEKTLRNNLIDISKIDPIENSFWSNTIRPDQEKISIDVNENDTLNFLSNGESINETAALRVKKDDRYYNILLNPENYSYKMKTNILKKIGYKVPDAKRVMSVKINFGSLSEKEDFLEYYFLQIDPSFFGLKKPSSHEWIAFNPKDRPFVILKDILIIDNEAKFKNGFKNLAFFPFLDRKEILNKRVFSSLAIIETIFNFKNNINLFEWWAARVDSQNIFLDNFNLNSFSIGYDDARWMLRRLANLSSNDWLNIIQSAKLPGPVSKVILEKIKSRYKSLVNVFNLDISTAHLAVDYKISEGIMLTNGKLNQCTWKNYAQEFCQLSSQEPLAGSDLIEFIKSRAFTYSLDSAIEYINSRKALRTDLSEKTNSFLNKEINEAINKVRINPSDQTDLLKLKWNFNYHDINTIFSRRLLTGRFQGSDELVNFVDTLGISLSAGKYYARMGYDSSLASNNFYPQENPEDQGTIYDLKLLPLSVRLGASITRTYSHLMPILGSIKEANKLLPFMKSIVPLVKWNFSKYFKDKKIKDSPKITLEAFKDQFKIGESFIIQDSIQTGANSRATIDYKNIGSLLIGAGSDYNIINRLNIVRVNENTLHIYKNFGNLARVNLNTAVNLYNIPAINANFQKIPQGQAKTQLYIISLDPNNPYLVNVLSFLKSLFRYGSLEKAKQMVQNELITSVLFNYNYNQSLSRTGIFWFNLNKIKSNNKIEVQLKDKKKTFYRFYDSTAKGVSIPNYLGLVAESLISNIFRVGVNFVNPPLNPGQSFKSKSKNNEFSYEIAVDKKNNLKSQSLRFSFNDVGWEATQDQINKKIEKLEKDFNYDYFPENIVHDIEKILIYNLSNKFIIFGEGIDNLFYNLKNSFIEDMINKPQSYLYLRFTNSDQIDQLQEKLQKLQKLYFEYKQEKKWQKLGKTVKKTISLILKKIKLEGISKLLSKKTTPNDKYIPGTRFFYNYASLTGFREGVEQKFMTFSNILKGNTFGSLGQYYKYASKDFNDQNTYMPSLLEDSLRSEQIISTPGELYINWILGRMN